MTRLDLTPWTEAEQRIGEALEELAAIEPLIHAETLSPNVARFIREAGALVEAYQEGLEVVVGMLEIVVGNFKGKSQWAKELREGRAQELCEGDGA